MDGVRDSSLACAAKGSALYQPLISSVEIAAVIKSFISEEDAKSDFITAATCIDIFVILLDVHRCNAEPSKRSSASRSNYYDESDGSKLSPLCSGSNTHRDESLESATIGCLDERHL